MLLTKQQSAVEEALYLADSGRYAEAEEALGDTEGAMALLVRGRILLNRDPRAARDCFSESFRLLGDDPLAVRAQSDLAVSYWLCGEMEEARVVVRMALQNSIQSKYRFYALLSRAITETDRGHLKSALLALDEAIQLNPPLVYLGKLHNQRSLVFQREADKGGRKQTEFRDKAILELDAASIAFETDNALEFAGIAANNMARLYLPSKQFDRAHECINRAVRIFELHGDKGHLGKACDERAIIFLTEGKLDQAISASRQAAVFLEATERRSWLAEACITLGRARARKGDYVQARDHLARAVRIAEHDKHQQALAWVAMLEEVPLEAEESFQVYAKIADRESQVLGGRALQKRVEFLTIRLALENAHGSVVDAAAELGLTQPGLAFKLKTQFPELIHLRNRPLRRRPRRSVKSSPRK